MKRPMSFAIATILGTLALATPIALAQTSAKTGDPRVKAILDKEKVNYEITPGGNFKTILKLPSGRTQLAIINSKTKKLRNLEIREISSAAYRTSGKLSADVGNQLLSDNANQKLGAWQAIQSEGNTLVLFNAQVDANNPEATYMGLLSALAKADRMEEQLTGKDDF